MELASTIESSDEECLEDLLTHTCFLTKAIKKLFLDEETSDVVLVVDGGQFHVHKNILSSRSKYFHAMFYGKMKESKQSEIKLEKTPAEPFKLILKYAYSSKIKLQNYKVKDVLQILELAGRYEIENLEIGICKHLEQQLSVDNICSVWDHANMFQIETLEKVCVTCAANNAEEILEHESFLNLSERTLIKILTMDSFCAEEISIFRGVQKWIKKNKPKKFNKETILFHIRLPLIDMIDLVEEVWESALFLESALLSTVKNKLKVKYEEINYRKLTIIGKNLALPVCGAKVVSGNQPEFLLDEKSHFSKREYTWNKIGDPDGITIELNNTYDINTIKMMLRDVDQEIYSYYINVSVDGMNWFCAVDNKDKDCQSCQTLSFPPTIAKMIRIVGTRSSAAHTLWLRSVLNVAILKQSL